MAIENHWNTNVHANIAVTDTEWNLAKQLAQIKHQNGEDFPFILSRNEFKERFPNLKHSFVAILDENNSIQIGCISRSNQYLTDDNKTMKEGILGYGKHGVIKHVIWENYNTSLVKIEANKSNDSDETKVMKSVGLLEGKIVRKRPTATPWIGRRSIKDKKYTLMKKVEGQPLNQFLKNNYFSEKDRAQIALALIKCVEKLQKKNIVHGDLQPANLIIQQTPDGYNIEVIDFGNAFITDINHPQKVTTKKSSKKFMAPEIGVYDWFADKWISNGGSYSKASDCFAVGKILEFSLGLNSPYNQYLIPGLTAQNIDQRTQITDARHQLQAILNNSAPTGSDLKQIKSISPAQALVMLIEKYKAHPNFINHLERVYLTGINSEQDRKLFNALKHDTLFKNYHISETPTVINNDPSRRYFETHFSMDTMKSKLETISYDMLQQHYDATKSLFKDMGGDISHKQWKIDDRRIKIRDYEQEKQYRLSHHLSNDNLVQGISKKEQEKLDLVLSGTRDPSLNGLAEEYADILFRIKNDSSLSDIQKTKASMIVKTTFLNMYFSQRYRQYGPSGLNTYIGENLPGDHIYDVGIYELQNRGRKSSPEADPYQRSHHLGLLKPDMPLDEDDSAYTSDTFSMQKPSDKNTYVAGSEWCDHAFSKLVHPFSNSISGTLLVQLKSMALLLKQGKLVLDSKEKIENYISTMITTMIQISGGHSLFEFVSPLFLKDVQALFKGIPHFDEIDMESLLLNNNRQALKAAIKDTIQYNQKLLANEIPPSPQDDTTQYPLHHAIKKSNLTTTIKLLNDNKHLMRKNTDGQTILDCAATQPNPQILLHVLEKVAASNKIKTRQMMTDFFGANLEAKRLFSKYRSKKLEVKNDIHFLSKQVHAVLLKTKGSKHNEPHNLTDKMRNLTDEMIKTLQKIDEINKAYGFTNLNDNNAPMYKSTVALRKLFEANILIQTMLTDFGSFNANSKISTLAQSLLSDAALWGNCKSNTFPEVMTINATKLIDKKLNHKLIPRDLSGQDFTFMNPRYIHQSHQMVSLLQEVLGIPAEQTVAFKPERALMHEIAAYVSTMSKVPTQDFASITKDLTAQYRSQACLGLKNAFSDCKNKATKLVKSVLQGKKKSNKVTKLINKFNHINLPSTKYPDLNLEQAVAECLAINKYKKIQEKHIQSLVADELKNHSKLSALMRKKPQNHSVDYFIAGGQASGKGEQIANINLEIDNQHGIQPDNYACINTDKFKSLTADNITDPYLFSQLTHPECKMIRQRALEIANQNQVPVIIDRVLISRHALNHSLQNHRKVQGYVISTNVLAALERNYQRGRDSGRYEDTTSLLKAHQRSVMTTLTTIKDYIGKDVQINFVDNNQAKDQKTKTFMNIDCKNRQVFIEDIDLLKNYLKKTFINIHAENSQEIFEDETSLNQKVEQSLAQLLKSYTEAGFRLQGPTLAALKQPGRPNNTFVPIWQNRGAKLTPFTTKPKPLVDGRMRPVPVGAS